MSRTATPHARTTAETSIEIEIDLDGTGTTDISTGIPFYDHMLDQLGRHGGFDLACMPTGDLHIDTHHTVEDVAIALGEAFARRSATRPASAGSPAAATPSTRRSSTSRSTCPAARSWCGTCELPESLPLGDPAFDPQLAEHAVTSFATAAAITLHVELVRGRNVHHIIEATFKGLARSLRDAVRIDGTGGVPSTKGVL
jgi:imidazoleglycerol-phosphate dehydratase